LPAEKSPGSSIYGGALNGAGSVTVEVNRTVAESTLSQIVQLVEDARGGRGRSEQLIDRFAAIYTPIVVIAAAVLALAGGIATGDWRDWIERGLVLLVVACPCALIISTPVAIVSAVGVAARRGFLVKGGAALEALATLRSVVFDKTGTLTQGRPSVVGVTSVDGEEAELIRLAAAVEALSEHPLGYAVLQDAAARSLTVPAATEFISTPGLGASALVDGRRIWIGAPLWFDQLSVAYPAKDLQLAADGRTVLLMAEERAGVPVYLGAIAVADRLRADSPPVVAQLKRLGLAPVAMMTGDNQVTAEAIARQADIDTVYAQLMPADKVRLVTDLRERLGAVGMVGDGVNDGPALGGATVGFAMGLTGSDLAVETSDVTILRNDLYSVPGAIDLSRRTVRIIKENIAFSLVVKVLALVLTVLGITNLWMAVALDLGTSLIVTSNALRLTRWQMPGATRAGRAAHHAPAGDPEATGEAAGLATGDA
jgi:Cd2+/Zn2+-exporting ATPase